MLQQNNTIVQNKTSNILVDLHGLLTIHLIFMMYFRRIG